MRDTTIDTLKRALSNRTKRSVNNPSLTPAAVLLLLYPKGREYHLIFNKRSQHVEYHKGEISFPGGARDPEDADMLSCALRETWEEMGIRPQDVTVLGELDEVPTVSRFAIHAYVGIIPRAYHFQVNKCEVAEVLEVPLSTLQDLRNLRDEMVLSKDGRLIRTRSYTYNHHLIYGATAFIVGQFLALLNGTH